MMTERASGAVDSAAIDELTATFYGAFTNRDGAAPDVERLHALFVPGAAIIKNTGTVPEIYDLDAFIAPRRLILTDGTLVDFEEAEISERTELFGNIAHRFSRYRKSWIASGKRFEGRGAKSIQFVRTPDGWKISSLTWDDDPVADA